MSPSTWHLLTVLVAPFEYVTSKYNCTFGYKYPKVLVTWRFYESTLEYRVIFWTDPVNVNVISHVWNHFRSHLFKHHGREAYAKFVEDIHKNAYKKPGICQVCGANVDNLRVHRMAWHPEISSPKLFMKDLSKGTRKLSQKPRWAERLNKRQKLLSDEGKLPPNLKEGADSNWGGANE